MLLVLFYVEDIKEFVVGSIRATDSFPSVAKRPARLPPSSKGTLKTAWRILVDEAVISSAESEDLQKLVDYRNTIAHQMHELTADIGRWADHLRMEGAPTFQPTALERITGYRTKIINGLTKRHIVLVSVRPIMFEAAERAFLEEIGRLKRKITNQSQALSEEIASANAVLRSLPPALLAQLNPGHPEQFRLNGTLSARGRACCAGLFSAGATPLVVAHLMRMSFRAAAAQHRNWLIGKGTNEA